MVTFALSDRWSLFDGRLGAGHGTHSAFDRGGHGLTTSRTLIMGRFLTEVNPKWGSNAGQMLVEWWSNCGQIVVKLWSNRGHVDSSGAAVGPPPLATRRLLRLARSDRDLTIFLPLFDHFLTAGRPG